MGCKHSVKSIDDGRLVMVPRKFTALSPPAAATTTTTTTRATAEQHQLVAASSTQSGGGSGDDDDDGGGNMFDLIIEESALSTQSLAPQPQPPHVRRELSAASSLRVPLGTGAAAAAAAAAKRDSVRSLAESEDPFANMSDIGDDMVDEDEATRIARISFSSRLFDKQPSISMLDEDVPEGGLLGEMIASGQHTYTASKLNEIDMVKEQALNLKNRFDLFFNPMLVRAVLEIVKAKETQIARAFERGDIDTPAYLKLSGSLDEARSAIARRTNINTVKTTRRMLRRTRTAGSIFDATGTNKSKWAPTLPPLFSDRGAQRGSVSVAKASMQFDVSSREVSTYGRTPSSSDGVNIKSLLHICVNEAFESILHELKDELLAMMLETRNKNLHALLVRKWDTESTAGEQHHERLPALARALDDVTRIVELYHPASNKFRRVRAKVKQLVITLDLVELQLPP